MGTERLFQKMLAKKKSKMWKRQATNARSSKDPQSKHKDLTQLHAEKQRAREKSKPSREKRQKTRLRSTHHCLVGNEGSWMKCNVTMMCEIALL